MNSVGVGGRRTGSKYRNAPDGARRKMTGDGAENGVSTRALILPLIVTHGSLDRRPTPRSAIPRVLHAADQFRMADRRRRDQKSMEIEDQERGSRFV